MSSTHTAENDLYKVVVNHEEQYSIWPAGKANPPGWKDIGKTGLKSDCLTHIKQVWTDMTPLSARNSLGKDACTEGLGSASC